MIKFSSSFKLNEIHSHFNKDHKNIIFSREALISGEGRLENLGKMGNNRDIYCDANWGGEFRKRISAPILWHQNPCDASIFLHAIPIFRKNKKERKFDPFLGSFPPKI